MTSKAQFLIFVRSAFGNFNQGIAAKAFYYISFTQVVNCVINLTPFIYNFYILSLHLLYKQCLDYKSNFSFVAPVPIDTTLLFSSSTITRSSSIPNSCLIQSYPSRSIRSINSGPPDLTIRPFIMI